MKKVLALVLALVLVLSLAACGGSGEKKEDTADKTEATESEDQGYKEIKIGETYSVPDFADITITKFDFSEEATSPDSDGINLRPNDGYVCANIYYDVKYIGKSKADSSEFKPGWLDYNDGYVFNLETFYYYNTGIDSWLNLGEIDPLSPEFSCKACFFVPVEVKNNEGNPLCIGFDSWECFCSIRP